MVKFVLSRRRVVGERQSESAPGPVLVSDGNRLPVASLQAVISILGFSLRGARRKNHAAAANVKAIPAAILQANLNCRPFVRLAASHISSKDGTSRAGAANSINRSLSFSSSVFITTQDSCVPPGTSGNFPCHAHSAFAPNRLKCPMPPRLPPASDRGKMPG